MDAPKKSSKTWLIILIVVLVLCCCCAVVGGLGYYLYNNGDALMQDWSALSSLAG
jgi:flagellar basal body-associated protein FliL